MKRIDAHIHYHMGEDGKYFAKTAAAAGHDYTPEHLQSCFEDLSVERAVVMGNRSLRPQDHQYPEGMYYCIGLDSTAGKDMDFGALAPLAEENLRREACVGVKLYPGYLPFSPGDKCVWPILELAQKYDKTVAVHTGITAGNMGSLRYSHPLNIDAAATAFPQVRFVICHMGNPWLQDAAAVLQKNENVFADLSGILEGKPELSVLLEEQRGYVEYLRTWMAYSGYHRLMYGSDWPLVNLYRNVDFFQRIVPEKHWESFFYQAAKHVYRLP